MKFIGREQEKAKLVRLLKRPGQNVALVFGRRRVGKSALIRECLNDMGATDPNAVCIYYECKQTTETNNVESLAAIVAEACGLPGVSFAGIEPLLEFLFARSSDRKTVLVLDEYPYLRKSVVGLDSILQRLVDLHEHDAHLTLVLCGSFADVMRSLLESANPLYGRVDLTIELKPMDYYDAARFYPDFSCEDKVRLFSVFGGIPYYNRLVDSTLSVRENVIELVSAPDSRLETEVEMYLRSEISKMENANEVFDALAQGNTKYGDILSRSHVSSGPAMVDVLDKLMRMELVQKRAPINCQNNKRRQSYRVVDGLSLFYYRYLFRYASQRSVMAPDAFYDRFIRDDFESSFVPRAFEEVCRQYLVRKNRAGEIDPPFELIGTYYYDDPATHTNGEFDVVTKDERGYAFYEAKFRREPVSQSVVEEEIRQVAATRLPCYKYGFFSRSGFSAEPRQDVELIGIEELYT